MNEINWSDFESQYWSPEKGKSYEVVLSNWRQETRSYDDGKTEKPVIVFDVLRVDKQAYAPGVKLFATGAQSFAYYAQAIIERAISREEATISVILDYDRDKKYHLLDLLRVRGQ